jgi:uncharacterized pyridoxamine 5'-phosphate oxidase family protein
MQNEVFLEAKATALEFLSQNKVGVVATVSPDSIPQAALVYYIFRPERELYFMTKMSARKYKNLVKNNRIGIVIGTMDAPITVQLQGTASRIEDAEAEAHMLEKLLQTANGGSGAWPAVVRMPGKEAPVVFKVTLDWMQLYDGRNLSENSPEENAKAFTLIVPEPV